MSRYLAAITALATLLPCVSAQSNATRPASGTATPSATSSYSQSDVPTGTSIPGNYEGAYRPQVHYSPPSGFMNDPNGMFLDDNGTYHLYYQCWSPPTHALHTNLFSNQASPSV
jgi:beta-fructofuranosidase